MISPNKQMLIKEALDKAVKQTMVIVLPEKPTVKMMESKLDFEELQPKEEGVIKVSARFVFVVAPPPKNKDA